MSKAILYSLAALDMSFSNPVVDSILNGNVKPQSGTPKQSFKQNRRKELTKSRKRNDKQF